MKVKETMFMEDTKGNWMMELVNSAVTYTSVFMFLWALAMSVILPMYAVLLIAGKQYTDALSVMAIGITFYWIVRDSYKNK